jgi:hypothetical protein
MDLTKNVPRSPKDTMLGLVSLARTIDKARAFNAGQLGEYDYDCEQDLPLFEFLGTNGEEFARKVAELETDFNLAVWLREKLKDKTPADVRGFNDERLQWHAAPGEPGYERFLKRRDQVAPGRHDVVTYFDLMDLDEKRKLPRATELARTLEHTLL